MSFVAYIESSVNCQTGLPHIGGSGPAEVVSPRVTGEPVLRSGFLRHGGLILASGALLQESELTIRRNPASTPTTQAYTASSVYTYAGLSVVVFTFDRDSFMAGAYIWPPFHAFVLIPQISPQSRPLFTHPRQHVRLISRTPGLDRILQSQSPPLLPQKTRARRSAVC